MKFIEKVLILLCVIGAASYFGRVDSLILLLPLGLVGLTFVYLSFGFLLNNNGSLIKGMATSDIISGAIAGIIHATMLAGIIFKFQHWPNGALMLHAGFIISLLFAAIIYFVNRSISSVLFKNILIRSIGIWVGALIMFYR